MALGRVVLTSSDRRSLARVLVVLNWVSVVTGSVLVGVGLYLWAELRRWDVVTPLEVVWAVPVVLVWTGLGSCAVNLTGARLCLDGSDPNRFLRWKLVLLPYVGVSLLLTFGVMVAAVLSLAANARLDAALGDGLDEAMRKYRDSDQDPGPKTRLDLLQIHMGCCGNDRLQDWFRVQWIPDRYLDKDDPGVRTRLSSNVMGRYLSDSVPFSCCDPASPWPCPQTHLSSSPAPRFLALAQSTRSLGLWGRGCKEALANHYSSILNWISAITVAVWAFELLVVTGVRYLQTSMENLVLLGDPESSSEAWILEESLCDTARHLDIIKSLGKCYHGNSDDDDPNINQPITGSGRQSKNQSHAEEEKQEKTVS